MTKPEWSKVDSLFRKHELHNEHHWVPLQICCFDQTGHSFSMELACECGAFKWTDAKELN